MCDIIDIIHDRSVQFKVYQNLIFSKEKGCDTIDIIYNHSVHPFQFDF